ncbi:MAG TPA: helix-turn-helix transcriptional regulator [Pirellulaceae bacterium]|nr:helix-turn-helix transcriptional regulator [Pirellulaceae bacterium]
MSSPRKKSKRVIRPLTAEETRRVADARREVEAERDEILREGRVAKQAWLAMRRSVDETVARLRAERERLGWSLADVEQKSGLRRSVLSRLENDKTSNPTLLTLQRYAAALGLNLQTTLSSNRA